MPKNINTKVLYSVTAQVICAHSENDRQPTRAEGYTRCRCGHIAGPPLTIASVHDDLDELHSHLDDIVSIDPYEDA